LIISTSVLLGIGSDSDNNCRENQNTYFTFNDVFSYIAPFMR